MSNSTMEPPNGESTGVDWDVDYFEVAFTVGSDRQRPKVVELPVVGSEWSFGHHEELSISVPRALPPAQTGSSQIESRVSIEEGASTHEPAYLDVDNDLHPHSIPDMQRSSDCEDTRGVLEPIPQVVQETACDMASNSSTDDTVITSSPSQPSNYALPINEPALSTEDVQETVEVAQVEKRRSKKIRDAQFWVNWFSSKTTFRIRYPPSLPATYGIDLNDLYVHSYHAERYQIWICEATMPLVKWTPITEGFQCELQRMDTARILVMTEGGQPSWVQPHSVERLYKRIKKGKARAM